MKFERIGFFPITGDPIHYGHLHGAIKVVDVFDLDCVFMQICGDIESHKPEKTDKLHRHNMARIAIREFEPSIRYTPLGYHNDLIGEDNFPTFMNALKRDNGRPDIFYIAGSDNERVVIKNISKILSRLTLPFEIIIIDRSKVGGRDIIENMNSGINIKKISGVNTYKSSDIRIGRCIEAVPDAVVAYCVKHNLYWSKKT